MCAQPTNFSGAGVLLFPYKEVTLSFFQLRIIVSKESCFYIQYETDWRTVLLADDMQWYIHGRGNQRMSHRKKTDADIFYQRPLMQGQKDSNPQQRFWRPTCYHYTMPLQATGESIHVFFRLSSTFFQTVHFRFFRSECALIGQHCFPQAPPQVFSAALHGSGLPVPWFPSGPASRQKKLLS